MGHTCTHRPERGSPMVPFEQLRAGMQDLVAESLNNPPEQLSVHILVWLSE
jgi:hypothetical protein